MKKCHKYIIAGFTDKTSRPGRVKPGNCNAAAAGSKPGKMQRTVKKQTGGKKMKELKKSLKQLGIKGHVIATKKSDLICISVNGIYIGIWSPKRNTFVD